MIQVSGLWIYPIKSCRGIAVDSFDLDERGPRNDRRWMLVDDDDDFLTQRSLPRMALIDVALQGDDVQLGAPGMSALTVAAHTDAPDELCTIWRDTIPLRHAQPDADAWFSEFLGMSVRLMRMPDATQRVIDPAYSPTTRLVTLADGYPILLIGEGSLGLLNEKLTARGESAVPIERFRPNIMVSGTAAHEEDEWASIRIGDVACRGVKPCARCTIPTVDIATGQPGKEPSRTLAEYRKHGSNIFFGQNVIHDAAGSIRRGDTLTVVNPTSS